MIEARGFAAVVEAADAMVKAAKVELVTYEKTGGGYVTAVVRGDVAAVKAAGGRPSSAAQVGEIVTTHVIARPHANVDTVLPLGRADQAKADSAAEPVRPQDPAGGGRIGRPRPSLTRPERTRCFSDGSPARSSPPARSPLMEGWRLLVVQQLGADNSPTGGYVVGVDTVGAGVGEVVLYASGPRHARPRSRRIAPATR